MKASTHFFSCSRARAAVAVAAAALVAVAVSSYKHTKHGCYTTHCETAGSAGTSMPFSLSTSSSYFCSWSNSIKFRCSRVNSRSLRIRVASISAILISRRSSCADGTPCHKNDSMSLHRL